MNIKYYNFIAKSNIKRNKKNNPIIILIALTTLLLVASSGYLSLYSTYANNKLNIGEASRCDIYPVPSVGAEYYEFTIITEEILEELKTIPHVKSIYKNIGIEGGGAVKDIILKNGEEYKLENKKEFLDLWLDPAYPDQKIEVIAGKTLDETPVYSCLVPNIFSLNLEDYNNNKFLKGEDFLGSTINISTDSVTAYRSYDIVNVPPADITLKVVGVYDINANNWGDPMTLRISNDTSIQIEQDGLATLPPNDPLIKTLSYNNPEHTFMYILEVDSIENVDEVVKKIQGMNIDIDYPRYGFDDGGLLVLLTFISSFLFFVITILGTINIFISVNNSLRGRRKEIGLLKAIGYTNKNIWVSMYIEQLKIAFKGFVIGDVIAVIIIVVINIVNSNGDYDQKYLVVSVAQTITVSLISLLFATIIPLICVSLTVNKLKKIEPNEAMKLN